MDGWTDRRMDISRYGRTGGQAEVSLARSLALAGGAPTKETTRPQPFPPHLVPPGAYPPAAWWFPRAQHRGKKTVLAHRERPQMLLEQEAAGSSYGRPTVLFASAEDCVPGRGQAVKKKTNKRKCPAAATATTAAAAAQQPPAGKATRSLFARMHAYEQTVQDSARSTNTMKHVRFFFMCVGTAAAGQDGGTGVSCTKEKGSVGTDMSFTCLAEIDLS